MSTGAQRAIVPPPAGVGDKFPGEAAVYMGIVHIAMYQANSKFSGLRAPRNHLNWQREVAGVCRVFRMLRFARDRTAAAAVHHMSDYEAGLRVGLRLDEESATDLKQEDRPELVSR